MPLLDSLLKAVATRVFARRRPSCDSAPVAGGAARRPVSRRDPRAPHGSNRREGARPRRGRGARRLRLRHDPSITPSSRQCAASGLNAAAALRPRPASRQRIAAHPSGRDHRVDRVLLHEDAVGDRDRDRAARAALADHARDGRHAEPRHDRLRAGDRAALPVLLREQRRICAGRVDQADTRDSRAGRRAPSRAWPCGTPPGTPCRSSASSAP